MAETARDAKLGAVGAHLLEFSQKMRQRETQAPRGPGQATPAARDSGRKFNRKEFIRRKTGRFVTAV